MFTLKTTAAFDSAHFLSGYNGKCANIHGHRWTIEASVSQSSLTKTGDKRDMVIDFGDFKREVRALADFYDHALIYESGSLRDKTLDALREEGFRLIEVCFRPTAERFAEAFYNSLKEKQLPVSAVTVYETPENCAVYEGEL